MEIRKLASAVGEQCRALRLENGMTLEDVAIGMRELGFRWSTSRVVELEAGKVAPTLGVLLGLARVFSEARAAEAFGLEHLIPPTHELLEIAPGVEALASIVREAVAERRPIMTASEVHRKTRALVAIEAGEGSRYRGASWTAEAMSRSSLSFGLADERAARALGLTMPEFLTVATSLWGRSLDEERYDRAPEDANAQTLGRVTRVLLSEARAYVERVAGA